MCETLTPVINFQTGVSTQAAKNRTAQNLGVTKISRFFGFNLRPPFSSRTVCGGILFQSRPTRHDQRRSCLSNPRKNVPARRKKLNTKTVPVLKSQRDYLIYLCCIFSVPFYALFLRLPFSTTIRFSALQNAVLSCSKQPDAGDFWRSPKF